LAANSVNLVANLDACFDVSGESHVLPRYLFVGPRGGDTPIRLGIFAGIHGDEPEGVYALVQFIKLLEANPELAAGYYLSIYPVCNPTGFEDNTRLLPSRLRFEPRILEGIPLSRKSASFRLN
jgi:protein MpaA